MLNKLFTLLLVLTALQAQGRSRVYTPEVKTLQVVVNQDWLSPPVMRLGTADVLHVSFDELSHNYRRYVYHLEHCEADWQSSADIFESDWLVGFNDNTIDDYDNSLNTTVLYTHYSLQIPNDRCRLKMSGNYRLTVYDEQEGSLDEPVLMAEFRVVEPLMNVGLSVTTNTDVDFNLSHQQVSMTAVYNSLQVTHEEEQLWTVVTQNGREDTQVAGTRPTSLQLGKAQWDHCRDLIFDAGNEYHKFEVLDVSHPTLGIDRMRWDGSNYHAFPFANEPRRHYVYDEDANGAFYIRNSDNIENDRTCDYVYVNYKLLTGHEYPDAHIVVDGQWATDDNADTYLMTYDETDRSYNARILQKQGYYSYQYLLLTADGRVRPIPEEGSFFQTENRYQAYVYYKGTGARTWRLVGYQQVTLK